MHEMSLAMNIVDIVAANAQSAGARSVNQVEVEVGSLAGVLIEALEFCFEAAARRTPVEGAALTIIETAGRGRCLSCGTEFSVTSLLSPCLQCGSYQVKIFQGKDLRVLSITIDE